MRDFKVTLLGLTENPQTISVAGALGCFEEKSSAQFFEELSALSQEERTKKEKGVLKNSFGRGHGSVGDQNFFVFNIENLPRVATLQLCLPEYLAHLQQSLRRARASRGFYLPEIIKNSSLGRKTEDTLYKSFQFYEKMVQAGIPGEDARFLLPLYTKTNIQTAGNARELCHLWQMSHRELVPQIVTAVVDEIISQAKERAPHLFEDFGFNYETLSWYPAAQLYSPENPLIHFLIRSHKEAANVVFLGYNPILCKNKELTPDFLVEKAVKERNEALLANLKHLHFEFLVPMSLACFHQAIRQRTWNHSVESIYQAVAQASLYSKERMVVPPSIKKSEFYSDYRKQHQDMIALYNELLSTGGVPASEAIGVIPHSVKIYTLVHINGWNAVHSIGKRTCLTAQWEIRAIARKMAKIIKGEFPELGKFAEPQCITFGGKCPEVKDCGYYGRKKQKN